jgi:multicomponent K+:H+ antiporter subunit D
MSDLAIAPVLVPLLAGILLLLFRGRDLRERRAFGLLSVSVQVLLALALLDATASGAILTHALGNWPAPFGIVMVADRLAAWMLLITALLALFALWHACHGLDVQGRHFHVLFQLQLFGLNGAFLTGDLFNLFVFFEVLLLASYGLVLHGGGPARTKAGLHYVVINLAGSSLFLIAAGLFYGLFGSLNLAHLALLMDQVPADNLGPARTAALLLFGVFALKSALLPLHLWLPATYARASAPVAALLAIMTKVGAYAILRVSTLMFSGPAGTMTGLIDPWLLPLAMGTLLVGLLGALAARRLTDQAAYLVIASVGTLLIAFGLGSRDAIAAGLYYLPHSTLAAAALFLLTERIAAGRGALADRLEPGPDIPAAPLMGALFFLCAILLAGLPPLSGFIGKFLLLQAAMAHPGWPWILGIVLLGGLLGLIALARSGSLLFFRSAAWTGSAGVATSSSPLGPAIGLLGLTLILTFWAGYWLAQATAIADQLLQPQLYIRAVLGGQP